MQHVNDRDTAERAGRGKSILSPVFAVLASLMGLVLVVWAIWLFCQIDPVTERHHASSPFPWKAEHVSVSGVDATWKSSEGDERMSMRLAYYPSATIYLGSSHGRGTLTVTFHDVFNRQVGEAIHIPYADGKFSKRNENWVQADGNTATCRMEAGFESEGEFRAHCIHSEIPYWNVKVIYREEGDRQAHFLGTVTIKPEETPVSK